jgi:hypothetical protein
MQRADRKLGSFFCRCFLLHDTVNENWEWSKRTDQSSNDDVDDDDVSMRTDQSSDDDADDDDVSKRTDQSSDDDADDDVRSREAAFRQRLLSMFFIIASMMLLLLSLLSSCLLQKIEMEEAFHI